MKYFFIKRQRIGLDEKQLTDVVVIWLMFLNYQHILYQKLCILDEVRFCVTGKSARQDRPVSKVVLVYFLGGCTYSEITALRFLGRLKGRYLQI